MSRSDGQISLMEPPLLDSKPSLSISFSVHAIQHGITEVTRTSTIYRMPSETLLRQYPWLRGIEPDEWGDFFPKTGSNWTGSDIEYLTQYWGKADIAELSYALERPPWNLQRVVSRLRAEGVDIPYLREDHRYEVST